MEQELKSYLRELANEIIAAQLTVAVQQRAIYKKSLNEKLEEKDLTIIKDSWKILIKKVKDSLNQEASESTYDLSALAKWD
jgi:hypothetical protein